MLGDEHRARLGQSELRHFSPWEGKEACLQVRSLADLRRDVAATRMTLREALDDLADRHRVPRRDVTYAMDSCADNLP